MSSGDESFEPGLEVLDAREVPDLPDDSKTSKKVQASEDDAEGPGVVYIGYVLVSLHTSMFRFH